MVLFMTCGDYLHDRHDNKDYIPKRKQKNRKTRSRMFHSKGDHLLSSNASSLAYYSQKYRGTVGIQLLTW
jgi:hypothetical protein